jgi:hypothetical protein
VSFTLLFEESELELSITPLSGLIRQRLDQKCTRIVIIILQQRPSKISGCANGCVLLRLTSRINDRQARERERERERYIEIKRASESEEGFGAQLSTTTDICGPKTQQRHGLPVTSVINNHKEQN